MTPQPYRPLEQYLKTDQPLGVICDRKFPLTGWQLLHLENYIET